MKQFNVIIYDINKKEFMQYDIIPYFINCYNNIPKSKRPKTDEEIKNFIIAEGKYQFWSRCQYEIIISSWPTQDTQKKIDVFDQIMMNIDLITKVFIQNI